MKIWHKLKEQPWANMAFAACFAILFYLAVTHLYLVLRVLSAVYGWIRPVFLGIIIAYVLNPMANWFERSVCRKMKKRHTRRGMATGLTLLLVILVVVVLMLLLIPQLIDSISTFFANFSGYSRSLQAMLEQTEMQSADGFLDLTDVIDKLRTVLGSLTTVIGDNMGSIGGVASSIGSGVFDAVLAFIVAIYILADKYRLKALLRRLLHLFLSDSRYDFLVTYWKRCNDIFVRFIVFDLLDGVLVGVINCIFMLIAGIPYSVLISVVVGVTNLAPTFGPVAGAVIGGLILLLVNPWYALWFLIFTVILQVIDGYVLKPKLFGGSLGVPAIWILITLIIGGRMLGVPGILLAIPFSAIIMSVCREFFPQMFRAEREKGDDEEEDGP
ncbi:MAG: AI-2E family transporter [Lachnospiraceae bacterium]|nr:AI-2E family transporter [Lachnospiraceae bacterium]